MKSVFARAKAQLLGIASQPANHKLVFVLFAVSAAAFLFVPEVAHAAGNNDLDAFDTLMIYAAKFFVWMAQIIGQLIVMLIGVVAVPILTYNEFANSQVIGTGWAIVRDVMNIGFVIVLMLIAFGTILFGTEGAGGRFNWRKNLPTLLIFAILINFSRMICGIMIDFGQVILLTFANAIKDIAGGNFIQLFGLGDIMSFNPDSIVELNESGEGLGIFYMLAAAIIALIMMSIVLLTIVTLIALLAFRIVVLWILVVLSPVAFFFGGAKNVLGGSFKAYDEWWANFTAAIAIGPVLVFVLWLALAVAGSGNIAGTEGFAAQTAQEGKLASPPIPNAALKTDNLVSFIIAIGILFAGFDISLKIASALPGGMKALVGPGVAARATKSIARIGYRGAVGAVGVGAGAALSVGRVGAGQALKYGKMIPMGGGQRLKDIPTNFGSYLKDIGKDYTKSSREGREAVGKTGAGLGGVLGSAVTKLGGRITTGEQKRQEKEIGERRTSMLGWDHETLLQKAQEDSPTADENTLFDRQAAQHLMLTEKRFRNNLSSDQISGIYDKFKSTGGEQGVMANDTMRDNLFMAKRARLDMLKNHDEDRDAVTKDWSAADMVKGVEAGALEDEYVQKMLKNPENTAFVKGVGRVTAWEAMGTSGNAREREAIRESDQGAADNAYKAYGVALDKFAAGSSAATSDDQVKDAVKSLENSLSAILKTNPDILKQLSADDMSKGGGMAADYLRREGTPQQLQVLSTNTEAAGAFEKQMSDTVAGLAPNDPQRSEISAKIFAATGNTPGEADQAGLVKVIMDEQPELTAQLIVKSEGLAAQGQSGLKNEIMKSISMPKIEEMMKKLNTASGGEAAGLKDSLKEMHAMLESAKGLSETQRQLKGYLKRMERRYKK